MTDEKEPKPKLTLEQKIEQQEQKLKQLKAQKQAAEAREKARKKEQDRNNSFHVPLLQGLIRQNLKNTFAHRSDLLNS